MSATRMISIIGLKNAGKTTFLVALAAELVRRKFRVMTIKHGSHPADMDQKGKDTWRHWHEGKAERVLMESPGQRVLFEHTEREADPITLARAYLSDADIVLVEGFKRAPLPKIEVYRKVAGPRPVFDPALHDPSQEQVIVADSHARSCHHLVPNGIAREVARQGTVDPPAHVGCGLNVGNGDYFVKDGYLGGSRLPLGQPEKKHVLIRIVK